MQIMSQEIAKIGPEVYDIANLYLELGSVKEVAKSSELPQYEIVEILRRPDIKAYLDGVYLDLGYRNRTKLAKLMDKIIDSKLEEAEETEMYTDKDLVDLIQLQHKMRIDEIKLEYRDGPTVNIANFADGNYGKLMEKLMNGQSNQ